MTPRPGSVAAWWHGSALDFAVVAGEEKQRVRLVGPRGREERVPVTRLAFEIEPPGEVPGKDLEQRRVAGERARVAAERVRRAAEGVDVGLLWEVVTDGGSGGADAVDPAGLAALAFESASGETKAAVLLALAEDGIHFVRKGEDWLPRDAAAVTDLKRERQRVAERASENAALHEALAASVAGRAPYHAVGSEGERRLLHALEQLAVREDKAGEAQRELALELFRAIGLGFERPHEAAFRVLRAVGRFTSDDENLQVARFGLRTSFPEPVLAAAASAVERGFTREGRRDLTALDACSIDGAHTREIDDALTIDSERGLLTVGIHIADPAAYCTPGDPVDEEAAARGLTYYMPDLRLPMLPPAISEDAASLVAGVERPALSFFATIGPEGTLDAWEIVRSIVRVCRRLDYAEVDAELGSGSGPAWLPLYADFAERRRAARMQAGAIWLRTPEAEIHVDADGRPLLERTDAASPAREIVTEAMVLAGEIAARFAAEHGLSVIHRRQAGAARPIEQPREGISDPVLVRRVRMSLQRAEVGIARGPHASLGLAAYAQATSPLRRFQDLATHRQIAAVLEGREPPYTAESLQRVLASTEQAEAAARAAERAADDFWKLRYLEQRVGQTVEAVVVQLEPRPVVLLLETMREQVLPAAAGVVTLGQGLQLRIERVNPRAGLLVLRGPL